MIQKEDKKFKTRIIIGLVLIALVSLIVNVNIYSWGKNIVNWIFRDNSHIQSRFNFVYKILLLVILLFFLIPVFIFAVYFWKLGNKVIKSKRFPPADTPVIKDTKVLTDEKAVIRGKIFKFISITLLISDFLIFLSFYKITSFFINILDKAVK